MVNLKERLYDDIVLDLYDKKKEIVSKTQKGNNGRGLNITITVRGVEIALADDAQCNFFLKKPDGHVVYVPCEITDGKTKVAFTQQMLTVNGYAEMEIQIIDAENGINITTPIGILEIRESNVSELAEPSEDEFPILLEMQDKINDLENQLADLTCEHAKILVFYMNYTVLEKGMQRDIFVSIQMDKTVKSIAISRDNVPLHEVANSDRIEVVEHDISTNTTFKAIVTDERGHKVTESKSLYFYNGVYTGVGDENTEISSLTKTLQSNRTKTFTVTADNGKYIYYACPTRYGTPVFKVGGFEGGFFLVYSGDFTNSSGYAESYQVWRSVNKNLGTITVNVT